MVAPFRLLLFHLTPIQHQASAMALVTSTASLMLGWVTNLLLCWRHLLPAGTLSRIASAPTGAEVSGHSFQWSGGRAYLTWTMQHPLDWEGTKLPRDAQEVRKTCRELTSKNYLACMAHSMYSICAATLQCRTSGAL